MKRSEMTDADKGMNPQHYGRDLVDIQIQINLDQSGFKTRVTFG